MTIIQVKDLEGLDIAVELLDCNRMEPDELAVALFDLSKLTGVEDGD